MTEVEMVPQIPGRPTTANATFCATVVDQWVIEGLSHAFIAPGSRSTPLVIALLHHQEVTVSLFHDERAASFAALGHGLATGRPAVVACSSGTAAAHFFAAIIEADLSGVPMLVCTADRPPELWDRGAPQTINQRDMYGSKVRASLTLLPPDDTEPDSWRPAAQHLWAQAVSAPAGPVHGNFSFRDPLTGAPGQLPPAMKQVVTATRPEALDADVRALADQLIAKRGVIIAGRSTSCAADIIELARQLNWPLLADHRSGCRVPNEPLVINRYDALLRQPNFVAANPPDVVMRVGEILSSKALSQWLTALDADIISTKPDGRLIDPENISTTVIDEQNLLPRLLKAVGGGLSADTAWLQSWSDADMIATDVADKIIAATPASNEIAVAQAVVAAVPPNGALVVSSSMPVREVEWFGPPRRDIDVYSNRGANGIDGVVSTAVGVAMSGRRTICLIGDVALLHDSTALIGLSGRPIDLTVVVVDNDGGGIFSFLPQHELLAPAEYEFLFGTPHQTDLAALFGAHHIETTTWPSQLGPSGVRAIIAPTSRRENLALHRQIHHAVGEALGK